jgi:GNAT superfamily N-acetyltransferase
VEFVPVRWWQAGDFIRLNLEVVQGRDPMADHILSRPWALSSLLEYAYMLIRFLRSNAHFIAISGERGGLVWTVRRWDVFFIITIGMLPRFQQRGIGLQTMAFVEEHARRQKCQALAAAVAPSNEPVHRLIAASGSHLLGLATTTLTFSDVNFPATPSRIEIKKIARAEAVQSWKRWRLYEVERVAGQVGVDVAAVLLKLVSLPRGSYLALYQDGQEIGFAFAHRREDEPTLGLFPSAKFWSGPQTAELVALLGSHLGSSARRLTLTQTHADVFAASAPFDFERHREPERHFAFKPL